jgi:hypothetical protein
VPAWNEAGAINVPAFFACIAAIGYGAYATHLFSFLGESSTRYWGPAPLEAWLLAGVLYLAGVAVVRAVAPASTKRLLGFDRHAIGQRVPPKAVIDIASTDVAHRTPIAAPARARWI